MPRIPIEDIKVGDRLREEYGDIDGLAESLKKHGLLHPIILDADRNLVCGGRRLVAAHSLEWKEIEYRDLGTLSQEERRLIELEENRRRKDLTAYEEAKNIVESAEVARQVAKEDAPELCPTMGQKSGARGRPAAPGSLRDIEERVGVPRETIHRAERVVETAETYPFMQRGGWNQARILEAREHLAQLGEEERPKAAEVVNGIAIPPSHAVRILGNLAVMAAEARAEIFRLHASEDSRDRSLALTRAADRVPSPDPRSVSLRAVVRTLQGMAQQFHADPFNDDLERHARELEALADRIRDAYKARTAT